MGQPLWEEGEEGSDEESGGGDDDEAEPPGPQPALVSLSESALEAGGNINLQTEVAQQSSQGGSQCPATVDQAEVNCGQDC